MRVTHLNSNRSRTVRSISLNDWFEEIRTAKYKDVAKQFLPAVMPSINADGQRPTKATVTAEMYTGMVCADIDDIGKHLDTVRSIAGGIPNVYAMIVSPSENGLKLLAKTDAKLEEHEAAFTQLCDFFEKELDVKTDRSCKDVVRLCYTSTDANIYINEHAEVFKMNREIARPGGFATSPSAQSTPSLAMKDTVLTEDEVKRRFKDCVQWCNRYKTFFEGGRNAWVFTCACAANRKGIPHDQALALLLQHYGYNKDEVTNCVVSAYKNKEEHGKYADAPSLPELMEMEKILYSDIELVNRNTDNSWVVEGLLRRNGLSVIGGVQDTGKSLFMQQLCMYLCFGIAIFCGYVLKPRYKKALIVSTEAGEDDISESIKKQYLGIQAEATGNLKVIIASHLSQAEILLEVEGHLTLHPSDIVVVDALGDLLDADMNSASAIRKILAPWQYLSKKHQTHICFVHHLNKAAHFAAVSHRNLTGSGAVSQKVRTALQLTKGTGDERYLTITKSNSLSNSKKENSVILHLNEESLLFSSNGQTILTHEINASDDKDSKKQRLETLAAEIFDGRHLTYTEFCDKHQQIKGTSTAQAQRVHKSMKEMGLIIKDGKGWKLNEETLPSAA